LTARACSAMLDMRDMRPLAPPRRLLPPVPRMMWCQRARRYVATVLEVNRARAKALVHYEGWSQRWDEWIDMRKAQPLAEGDAAQREARLQHQMRTRSPNPRGGGRGAGGTAAADEGGRSPLASTEELGSMRVRLGDITGVAPRVFTEPVDPHTAALIVVNQAGDPTMRGGASGGGGGEAAHVGTAAADHANAVGAGALVLERARHAGLHVLHITLGCFKTDGSDLEYFKQRALGDDHAKLNVRNVPYEYSPAPGEAVLLSSTSSAFASTGLEMLLKVRPPPRPAPPRERARKCGC
jgi:hypothetical protein